MAARRRSRSERLQISQDDIHGTLYPTPGGQTSLVNFDTVSGGAGSAIRIARSFGDVLDAALARVASCNRSVRTWFPPSACPGWTRPGDNARSVTLSRRQIGVMLRLLQKAIALSGGALHGLVPVVSRVPSR